MSHAPGPSWAQDREATALDAQFVPGTNRRGELSGADWRFLLPAQRFDRILFLGSPTLAVLSALSTLARTVVVLSGDLARVRELNRAIRRECPPTVHAIRGGAIGRLPFCDSAFDLVVAPGGRGAPRLHRSPGVATEIERILRPEGTVYFETASVIDTLLAWRWMVRTLGRGFAPPRLFWLVRRNGEIRAALPLEDAPRLGRYFFDHVLYGRSRTARALRRLGQLLVRARVLHHIAPHRAVLLQRRGEAEPSDPPFPYLATLAEGAGIRMASYRAGFFARGQYDANKVALFVFDRSENAPEIIVKMTRAAEYNDRLETEYHSLRLLGEKGYVEPGSYPEVLFLGHHGGLAILGERVVHGSPFRTRTTNEPTCPYARDAIEWLLHLGTASADRSAATPREVSTWLLRLLTRFTGIYTLSEAEKEFLGERIAAVGRSRVPLPLVFRHGDAGTWNVLVTANGRAAFLDWEASEPQGPPLWDLFHFMRSFGTWLARIRGERDNVGIYASSFLAASPLSTLQAETTERYCASVRLDRSLVEPLFYTCWMHRALREAAWRSGPLERGTYISLLRLCIERRNSPGLQWIFS